MDKELKNKSKEQTEPALQTAPVEPPASAEDQGKHPGGAPSKLTEAMVRKAQEYYDVEATDKPIKDGGGNIIGHDVNLPTKEGLALYLNVSRKTLYNWAEDTEEAYTGLNEEEIALKEKFLHIFDKIMSEQGKRLINKGLAGKYNPLIGKMLLSKHGYKDAVDITSDEEPVRSIAVEISPARDAVTPAAKEAQAVTAQANETPTERNASIPKEPSSTP